MPLKLLIRWLAGQAAGTVAGNELFDLPCGAVLRLLEPDALCLCRSDTRELSHLRPVAASIAQRPCQLWQCFERFGDPQLVVNEARRVAEYSLDVLDEAAEAEACVHFGAPH